MTCTDRYGSPVAWFAAERATEFLCRGYCATCMHFATTTIRDLDAGLAADAGVAHGVMRHQFGRWGVCGAC